MARAVTWLDVFTARPLTGNGLAVVHDADGLDDETMLGFARETRLSETSFVQTATEADADYRNRIWMTTGELDFAGHPSLGVAVAVARARGEREARYVQQTRPGLQPIDVELGDAVARASMLQEPAVLGAEVEPGVAALRELLGPLGCTCAYLAFCEPEREAARARSFFVDIAGVTEDPATGSAAGPLMAYLHARAGAARLTIEQGVEMGRPSRLECEAGERVRVGGEAVVVLEGTLAL